MAPLSMVMLTHYFEDHRGGIEIVAGRLAREFAAQGHPVTWIATGAEAPATVAGVACAALPASNVVERLAGLPYPLLFPAAWRRIFTQVARHDAVILHDGIYLTSLAGWLASRRHGKPCILVQHIGEVPYRNPLLRGLMKLANTLLTKILLRRVDRVVFISDITRRFFADLRLPRLAQVILNGVDTETFRPPSSAGDVAQARLRLGLPETGAICLFVGRFVEKKGLALLRGLAERRGDVTFACAGWGPLDPARWGLQNVRTFSNLAGARLAELYQACDVFVLPSVGEGFPLVLQEAMACGLPAICGADTAEADPQAAHLLSAVKIDLTEADATIARLEIALSAVLAQPRNPQALHDFAREHYSWPQAAARYVALVREVMADQQSAARTQARM